ncbi:MAG: ABC transporter ATP-binding protein [Deltaproteobacteria bacterium]|nr:ABC transporter ATP-binding protein [Deltaproteobacteria bacterium]
MARLWSYMLRYRGRYAFGLFCLLATGTLAMAVPYLLKRAVDAIAAGSPPSTVAWLALGIILIALVQALTRTFSRFLIFNVGRDIEYDLRNDLFAHLERLPLAYYQTQQTGDLMSRLVNDITAVRMLLGVGFLNLVNTPIYYVYAASIMVSLDWRLTLAALAPYPLVLVIVKRSSRQLMERTLRVQEGLAAMSSRVQENLSGIHVVKAYVREQEETEEFARLNADFSAQNMELAQVRGIIMPVMRAVSTLTTLVVLWYGGLRVIAGVLSLGDLVAFIGYLHILAWPTMALGWMLSIVQRGRAALQRLEQIFVIEPAIDDRGLSWPEGEPLRGEIAFTGVDFAYHTPMNGHRVLAGVNLTVPAGATLAIVGRTGAGKTTLVDLIPRLFDVTAGTVTIDGRDVREIPLAVLRRAIGFVPQDPFLFSRNVRDNVRFGAPDASDAAVDEVAAIAALDRDVSELPHGYDTIVGERGITLSGGQKQRVTLARALLVDPTILILDDALSSVDTETEGRILGRLRGLMRQRTSIVIAHRISTVRDADLIAVVDDGRIVELGDHATLLAHAGFYADLFQRQRLTEELEAL